MNPARVIMWFLGAFLVVVALAMLYFNSGLDNWIPAAIAGAGLLLIIGLLVLSFAGNAPSDAHDNVHAGTTVHKEEHHH